MGQADCDPIENRRMNNAYALMAPSESLSTTLFRMVGRPFGIDSNGKPIDHSSGKLIVSCIEWMQTCVARRAELARPPGAEDDKRYAAVEFATDGALERLVKMVNQAIEDERYQVTRDYLLDESNWYSYEFSLFVADYCRVISGDSNFFFNEGSRGVTRASALLVHPLGIERAYAVAPRLIAKFVKTDLRVVDETPTAARVQWHGAAEMGYLPIEQRPLYVRYACQAYQGVLASIPSAVFGRPSALIREICCQEDGAEYCEWEFTWKKREPRGHLILLIAGAAISLLTALALDLGWISIVRPNLVAAVLPLILAGLCELILRLSNDRRRLGHLLDEQRDLAEAEYDRTGQTRAALQLANVELNHNVSELTTLHEIGLALSATLDLDELLQKCLEVVVSHLHFERAIALLVDESKHCLTNGHSIGCAQPAADLVNRIEVSSDDMASQVVQVLHAGQPILFHNAHRDAYESNRALTRELDLTNYLGTPFIAKGRRIGVLLVDNWHTGRPTSATDAQLLFTVGNQIASAVEGALLYRELELQNRMLEHRVAERTAELETANRELESFGYSVSHDLRAPLRALNGFSRILLNDFAAQVPAEAQRFLNLISENADHMGQLVDDLLAFSRLSRQPLKKQPVMPDALIRQTLEDLRYECDGRQVDISVGYLPECQADPALLRQVFVNLIANALKFTRNREPATIEVGSTCAEGADETVYFVRDNGVGFDMRYVHKLFGVFQRLHLAEEYEGTGVGLAIVERIIHRHGGRIWAEAEVDKGATFYFTLSETGV